MPALHLFCALHLVLQANTVLWLSTTDILKQSSCFLRSFIFIHLSLTLPKLNRDLCANKMFSSADSQPGLGFTDNKTSMKRGSKYDKSQQSIISDDTLFWNNKPGDLPSPHELHSKEGDRKLREIMKKNHIHMDKRMFAVYDDINPGWYDTIMQHRHCSSNRRAHPWRLFV